MFRGINRRWLINTFGVVLAIIILLVVTLSVAVHSLCYSTVETSLKSRSEDLEAIFPDYTAENADAFIYSASVYAADFGYKDEMEVEVVDSSGRIVSTSSGFESGGEVVPGFENAQTGTVRYVGRSASGEKIMAISRVIVNPQGTVLGAVRYTSSLRYADGKVFLYTIIASVVGLIIITVVALSGYYFIRSIVKPVNEMSETAQRIAQGDFTAKIDKMYDDEIGDLCLRTPLTAIKGWAETMQYDVPDRITLEKCMTVIVNESTRLTSLVEELLDFSKLQSGRLTMQMARMDILAEIDEAVYMLRERALSEGKHLLYDDPEEMPIIYGDRNRLKQVFLNVIDNALKYTPEGGMIGVQVYQDFKERAIKVVVADNGCGIKAEDLPKVKDKFYKANQKINGSGIGLAVADEIIKLHKGTLEIESSPEVGTTVTITIPIYNEAAALDDDSQPLGGMNP